MSTRIRSLIPGLIAIFAVTQASTSKAGDYAYQYQGEEVVILGYIGNAETVDVPGFIDGKPVVKIMESAFFSSHQVVHINLPDSIREIGGWAFNGCESLVSVRLSSSLTKIGASAFNRCFSLESLDLPDGVTEIPAELFRECKKLERVTLSPKTWTIGSGAFVLCGALQTIELPPGLITIQSRAFQYSSLLGIEVPESVSYIGDEAFLGCGNLASIHLPNGLKHLGGYALADCKHLTEVELPTEMTVLDKGVLASCEGLRKVTLPPGLKQVGDYAFESCYSLYKVVFPKTLRQIGMHAFTLSGIEQVRFEGPVPKVHAWTFSDPPPAMVIYYYDRNPGYSWPVWNGVPSQPIGPEILLEAKELERRTRTRYKWLFGDAEVGKQLGRIMSVRNVGTAKLGGLTARIVDDPTGSFSCDGFSKRSIAPHSVADLKVVFQPGKKARGHFSVQAHLEIRSNDENESPIIIGLSGIVDR